MKDFIKHKIQEYLNIVDESNIVTIDKISPDADEITRNIVLPVAKALYRGINKLKRGEYEFLTSDEKKAINKIFPKILNRKTKEFRKDFEVTDGYQRPEEFFKIYKIKTLDGKNKKISVGFYYNKNVNSIAYFETQYNGIAINVAKLDINNLNQLESTIRHELVHSADPKVVNPKIRKSLDAKEIEYAKQADEFDAFSHEFITTIDKNLKMIPEGETKDNLLISLWFIVTSLKNGFSEDVLFKEYYNDGIIRLFSENGVTSKNIRALRQNYFQFLSIAEIWAKKPTLFDKFMNRLVRYAPYKV